MYNRLIAIFLIMLALMTFPASALAQDDAVPQATSGEVISCPDAALW